MKEDEESVDGSPKHKHVAAPPSVHPNVFKPLVVYFSVVLNSLTIGAALLPSLKAQYKVQQTKYLLAYASHDVLSY